MQEKCAFVAVLTGKAYCRKFGTAEAHLSVFTHRDPSWVLIPFYTQMIHALRESRIPQHPVQTGFWQCQLTGALSQWVLGVGCRISFL